MTAKGDPVRTVEDFERLYARAGFVGDRRSALQEEPHPSAIASRHFQEDAAVPGVVPVVDETVGL